MKRAAGLLPPLANVSSNDGPIQLESWGKQWAQCLGEQFNPRQVWLAWKNEYGHPTWMVGWPHGDIPPSIEIIETEVQALHTEEIPAGQHLYPLIFNEMIIGWLLLLASPTRPIAQEFLERVSDLTPIMALQLSREQERSRLQLAEHSISHLLQSSLEVDRILTQVLGTLSKALDADALLVSSHSPPTGKFDLLTVFGLDAAFLTRVWYTSGFVPVRKTILDRKQPVLIDDLRDALTGCQLFHSLYDAGYRQYLAIPLIGHNATSGILEIIWRAGGESSFWKEMFLTHVARQIAFAMERSALVKDLRQAGQNLMTGHVTMFEGLGRILGLRDHETEEHTLRVSRLAMRLVEHMQIPQEYWGAIRIGALLHDIGKLGVPDAILLKPGSLNDAERRMMQMHVTYGFNILSPITNLQQALDIVRYHHERWDGKGYPEGLKGDQIPLVARLFAVVDVFDALTADRPYRAAWLRAKALDYLGEESGRQFDPQMVKAFLEIIEG